MKTFALIFTLSSVVLACPKGSEPYRDGVCVADIKAEGAAPDESAKWVSDEKPPKHAQPAWQTGEANDMPLQNTDVAQRSPPDSCKGAHQIWTGAQCLEGEDPSAGKKPKETK